MRVEQFNWLTGLEPLNSSLQGIRGKLIVSGGLREIMKAHLSLMTKMPTVQHESIEIREANMGRSGYRLSLTLFVPVQKGGKG